MISSEVQRTLVKSPPELWAELSDPAALARHLGELGEIRIVRTEPERVVEWAAENTTGVVSIKPSGWGTRVTLSVARERMVSAPAPDAGDTAAESESEPAVDTDATTVEASLVPEPEVAPAEPEVAAAEPEVAPTEPEVAAAEPEVAPTEPEVAAAEPEVEAAEPEIAPVAAPEREPEPRRGFFARLFRRRPRAELLREVSERDAAPPETDTPAPSVADSPPTSPQTLAVKPSPERSGAFAAVRQVLAPETFAAQHPFAQPADHRAAAMSDSAPATTQSAPDADGEPEPEAASGPDGGPSTDIAAELMAAEEVTADEVSAAEVTAVLTAVLDRLGAAHHRPFSRG